MTKRNKPKLSNNSANDHIRASTSALLNRALSKHQLGKLSEAEALYQQILNLDPCHFDALHFLGLIKRTHGELDASLSLLFRATQASPENASIYASLGSVLLELRRYNEAILYYDAFLNWKPDFPEVMNNRGIALASIKRYDDALLSYNRSIEIQPSFLDATFNRGNLYLELGEYSLALQDFNYTLSLNPAHFHANHNRGNALYKMNRLDEALCSYRSGLAAAPGNCELLSSMAYALKMKGDIEGAVKYYNVVLETADKGFTRQNAALQLAIIDFVYLNSSRVDSLMNAARDMLLADEMVDHGSQVYCAYLLRLLEWWATYVSPHPSQSSGGYIHAIGESHVLSVNQLAVLHRGQVSRCRSYWVEGCTQWKVVGKTSNPQRELVLSYLSALPESSTVLIAIGEIDCRINGGVYKAYQDDASIPLIERIKDLVTRYIEIIGGIASSRRLQLIISGIPASNIEKAQFTAIELKEYGYFLKQFNQILKYHSLQSGMYFLDVFQLTDAGDGYANTGWHIDNHHLYPSTIVEAFHTNLHSPSLRPSEISSLSTSQMSESLSGVSGEQTMKILFIHQNFPGQFVHLATRLAQDPLNDVRALTMQGNFPDIWNDITIIPYRVSRNVCKDIHPWLADSEPKVIRGEAALKACCDLKDKGFTPDIIIAHSGWGESLFVKDIWPSARLGIYAEYFYHAHGADVGFDPEFSSHDISVLCKVRMKNVNNLLNLSCSDQAISPTRWQWSTFPIEYQNIIDVIHDGIRTDNLTPNANTVLKFDNGMTLSRKDEIVTFVNRNLEPYRGYHIFMRSLPEIIKRRPNVRVLIVGGDSTGYGAPPSQGTWKNYFLQEIQELISPSDRSRILFLGNLQYDSFVSLLQISRVHVYMTYPFILSWSLIEAMSVGCAIVASDTAPVREVIVHDETGRLVNFFDPSMLAHEVCDLLQDESARLRLGGNARAHAVEHYDLHTVCLPAQLRWVHRLCTSAKDGLTWTSPGKLDSAV